MVVTKLFGTGAVVLLVLLSGASEWPEPRDSWTRVICALIALGAIWL